MAPKATNNNQNKIIKILHININSIKNKIPEILNYLNNYDADVISINETKLSPTENINLPGFKIFRRDVNSR